MNGGRRRFLSRNQKVTSSNNNQQFFGVSQRMIINNLNRKKSAESKGGPDVWLGWGKLIFSLSVGYGLMLFLMYCYSNLHALPSGLSITDNLLLILFCFIFSFFIICFVSISACVFIPSILVSLESSKREPVIFLLNLFIFLYPIFSSFCPDLTYYLSIGVLTIILFSFYSSYYVFKKSWGGFFITLFISFIWLILGGIIYQSSQDHGLTKLYAILTLTAPFLAHVVFLLKREGKNIFTTFNLKVIFVKHRFYTFGTIFVTFLLSLSCWQNFSGEVFVNTTVAPLGIYNQRTVLWLSKDNVNLLTNAANVEDKPISICRNDDGSAVVSDMRVWWHGIGSRSYVQILPFFSEITEGNSQKNNASSPVLFQDYVDNRVELESAGVRMITLAKGSSVRCAEMSDNLVFDSNSSHLQLSAFSEKKFKEDLDKFLYGTVYPVDDKQLKIVKQYQLYTFVNQVGFCSNEAKNNKNFDKAFSLGQQGACPLQNRSFFPVYFRETDPVNVVLKNSSNANPNGNDNDNKTPIIAPYVKRIDITGYADPMSIKNGHNETLALERANAVAHKLYDVLHNEPHANDPSSQWHYVQNAVISLSTKGARETSKDCLSVKNSALAKECNATNRHADIRLYYGKMDASDTAAVADSTANCDGKTLAQCGPTR